LVVGHHAGSAITPEMASDGTYRKRRTPLLYFLAHTPHVPKVRY